MKGLMNNQVINQTGAQKSSAFGNVYQFTGRRLDNTTGLYYYRNRYYETTSGRFLSRDPMKYINSMNLFTYVLNNPINAIDPLGLTTKYFCCHPIDIVPVWTLGFNSLEDCMKFFHPDLSEIIDALAKGWWNGFTEVNNAEVFRQEGNAQVGGFGIALIGEVVGEILEKAKKVPIVAKGASLASEYLIVAEGAWLAIKYSYYASRLQSGKIACTMKTCRKRQRPNWAIIKDNYSGYGENGCGPCCDKHLSHKVRRVCHPPLEVWYIGNNGSESKSKLRLVPEGAKILNESS